MYILAVYRRPGCADLGLGCFLLNSQDHVSHLDVDDPSRHWLTSAAVTSASPKAAVGDPPSETLQKTALCSIPTL